MLNAQKSKAHSTDDEVSLDEVAFPIEMLKPQVDVPECVRNVVRQWPGRQRWSEVVPSKVRSGILLCLLEQPGG